MSSTESAGRSVDVDAVGGRQVDDRAGWRWWSEDEGSLGRVGGGDDIPVVGNDTDIVDGTAAAGMHPRCDGEEQGREAGQQCDGLEHDTSRSSTPELPVCCTMGSMIALHQANIDHEICSDRVILWLPVDRPIVLGRGGLIAAGGLILAAMAFIGAVLKAPELGILISDEAWLTAIFCGGMLMLSIAGLATRDVGMRLGERLIDRIRPLHTRRERLEITQHVVTTAHGPIDLSAIQVLVVRNTPMGTKLIGETAFGDVEVAQHRSARVLEAVMLLLQDKVQRRREVLIAQGVDPDSSERVPELLAQLRAAPSSSGR